MKSADTPTKTLQMCFLCDDATYCCQEHCNLHWPQHRSLCNELRCRPGVVSNLYNACDGGHHEELKKMLQRGGLDVDWATPNTGRTAALAAAAEGHDKCLTLLGQYGADLSKPNNNGYAPIHAACQNGRYACLTPLLDHGVDINQLTARYRVTAAKICCSYGMVKCLAVLLDQKADMNLVDSDGHTAVHLASTFNQVKCLQLLIKRGAVINHRDNEGRTPLDLARIYGHRECVDLLLENGAVGASEEEIVSWPEAEKVHAFSNAMTLLAAYLSSLYIPYRKRILHSSLRRVPDSTASRSATTRSAA